LLGDGAGRLAAELAEMAKAATAETPLLGHVGVNLHGHVGAAGAAEDQGDERGEGEAVISKLNLEMDYTI